MEAELSRAGDDGVRADAAGPVGGDPADFP